MLNLTLTNLVIVAALLGILFTLVVIRVCQYRMRPKPVLKPFMPRTCYPENGSRQDKAKWWREQADFCVVHGFYQVAVHATEIAMRLEKPTFNDLLGGYSGPLAYKPINPSEVTNAPIVTPQVDGTCEGSDPRNEDTRIMKIDSVLAELKPSGDESTQDLDPICSFCYSCLTEISGEDIFSGHTLCKNCRCSSCGMLNPNHTICTSPCN